ncbi:DUF333 domain-containing protein [Novosphingobium sp. BL-8H]|uniref:putative hemolysin n=1 Tax=Novosphingobium sp. BL-8H TaxID=3127640 RepID=UPI0037573E3F
MRIAILCMPVMLAACASTTPPPPAATPSVGMANPASKYCVEQGGRSEIRREPQGETGYCHLPDGRVVEEWQFYRAAHPASD